MRELCQFAQTLLGLRLAAWQIKALEKYEQELLSWNERVNLTAIREPDQIRVKHFLELINLPAGFSGEYPRSSHRRG